jgi:hypothetical protein
MSVSECERLETVEFERISIPWDYRLPSLVKLQDMAGLLQHASG